MKEDPIYDVAIAGGGLAGLALSIQLAAKGYQVILFEKEQYPFHRVCGEYISMESWGFLESLGLRLRDMDLPVIEKIAISGKSGLSVSQSLPMGGFGISRFKLDQLLAEIARKSGVKLLEGTRVNEISFSNEQFLFQTGNGDFRARAGAACFGKRSNLDIKWKRSFASAPKNKLNNYIGIKYHVRSTQAPDTISLHWFDGGYCGLTKVENDLYCLCYLTTAGNLQRCDGDINLLEEKILCQNKYLADLWKAIQKITDKPVTISQISFDRKEQLIDHLLMVGDAAGMITPLCGNGMSMALHGSKLAFEAMEPFLAGRTNREQMEKCYEQQWKKKFSKRMRTGRTIQALLAMPGVPGFFIRVSKIFPGLLSGLIRQTHGKPF